MTIKTFKPRTKSLRHTKIVSHKSTVTVSEPVKALTWGGKRPVGRNNVGRITVRHKGGGHKRLYRDIDFRYEKIGVPYRIASVEYDPNRTGLIGLAVYKDGAKRYVLLPKNINVGEHLLISETAEVKQGNRLPLSKIPVGAFVYNVELKPNGGAKIARSAGNFVQVVAKDAGYADLKMPSSEIRKVRETCWASIGEVSNEENRLVNMGKAGRSRWLGIRPTVRGSAMNPVDHPMGGGEGKACGGHPQSAWGVPAKGYRTRNNKRTQRFVAKRRKK